MAAELKPALVLVSQPAAHLYLLPMKCLRPSMSPSAGRWKALGRRSSQNRLARLLPMSSTKATCSGSQVSSVVERTLDMCVPKERWMPEQFRHTKTPRLTEALLISGDRSAAVHLQLR